MKQDNINYKSSNTKPKSEFTKHHYTLGNDKNDFQSEVNSSFKANKGVFAPVMDGNTHNATTKTNFVLGTNITSYQSSSNEQNVHLSNK